MSQEMIERFGVPPLPDKAWEKLTEKRATP